MGGFDDELVMACAPVRGLIKTKVVAAYCGIMGASYRRIIARVAFGWNGLQMLRVFEQMLRNKLSGNALWLSAMRQGGMVARSGGRAMKLATVAMARDGCGVRSARRCFYYFDHTYNNRSRFL